MLKIGDKVWYAQRKTVRETLVCPDCFGKKALTVIKGDGSQVSIACARCSQGYDPPEGVVFHHKQIMDVSQVMIDRVEQTVAGTEYGFRDCYRAPETDLFVSKKGAEKRAQELAEEHNQKEIARVNQKEKCNRTWAWHVYYHGQAIKNAKKDLAYHTARLNVAKTKAKETSK